MKLATLLLFVCGSSAVNLQIDGEVSFDLKLPSRTDQTWIEMLREKVPPEDKNQVTAGPVVECIYQYPEQKQIAAILSNMMNVLTKVFVRAHDYFTIIGEGRRAVAGVAGAAGAEGGARRPADSRFRVIDKKNTQFFEHIYHNMTDEYSKFYNMTAERVDRSERDPCQHQAEIKKVWRELLDHSMAIFRRAALRCVGEHLRVQRNDEKYRGRLGQFLVRELAKVRSGQLHLLCDRFQLCFNELL